MLFSFIPYRFTYQIISALAVLLISANLLNAQVASIIRSDVPASNNRALTSRGSLKLLTWNLHLLPAVVINKNQKARARGIAKVLSDSKYDVIVFQEALHRRARKIIWKVKY